MLFNQNHERIQYLSGSSPAILNINGDKETAHDEDIAYSSPYNLYYICFSDSERTDMIKNGLACRNLNSLVVEVNYRSANAEKYDINVSAHYFKALSIDGSSGAISTALSN